MFAEPFSLMIRWSLIPPNVQLVENESNINSLDGINPKNSFRSKQEIDNAIPDWLT